MATVTGFTAERMLQIENETIVNAELDGDDLILYTREGVPINVGNVRGAQGPQGGTNVSLLVAASDETTTITVGAAKTTFRMPYAMTVIGLRGSLNTASSAGVVTVDVNVDGVSVLSTKLTIDVGEKTSVTAAIPPVFSDNTFADDAEVTIDIDVAGTGAKGLKLTFLGDLV